MAGHPRNPNLCEPQSWVRETANLIAAAGFDMSLWPEIPARITARFPGSNFILQGSDKAARVSLGGHFSNLDPSMFDAYERYYCAISPWLAFWNRAPVSSVFVSERIAPSRTFRDTEFYRDWLEPNGMLCAVGAKLFDDDDRMAFMASHYEPRDAGRYERPIAEAFSALVPALRSAIALNRHLAANAAQMGLAGQVLDAVALPALAIDMRGKLKLSNVLGAKFLRGGHLLRERDGRVSLIDQKAARQFQSALAGLDVGAPAQLVLRDTSGVMTALLDLVPVTTEALKIPQMPWLFEPERLLLMLIRERKQLLLPDEAALRIAFALTPAEARLAKRLAAGDSLESAAEALGIRKETARSQLRHIFAKTGTQRQAALVARLAHLSTSSGNA